MRYSEEEQEVMWADGSVGRYNKLSPHSLSTGNHLWAAHKMAALSLLMEQSITTALMGCQHQFTEKYQES